MAARTTKTTLSDSWKERISNGVILDRLMKHIEGEIEMTSTQIAAAKILLGKVIPDLSAMKHSGDSDNPLIIEEIRRTIVDTKFTDSKSS